MDIEKYVVVIPARMASTRLPKKPLIKILGKSLIERTWNQVVKVVDKSKVFVLTDHIEILQHCKNLNISAVMTPLNCLTGTDRIAEFAKFYRAEYYINVQGDEPLINPNDIIKVIECIETGETGIINGFAKIDNENDYFNANIPKVVFSDNKRLMYMSRSPIPGNKDGSFSDSYRQICIYAYPNEALIDFSKQKKKSFFEKIEDIEILRFLEMGYEVKMIEMSSDSIAVDVEEDIEKVILKLKDES
jgi:3-deoxy-manno-octulosonate cytidylyltransferase (CMP-KDO synthetase)